MAQAVYHGAYICTAFDQFCFAFALETDHFSCPALICISLCASQYLFIFAKSLIRYVMHDHWAWAVADTILRKYSVPSCGKRGRQNCPFCHDKSTIIVIANTREAAHCDSRLLFLGEVFMTRLKIDLERVGHYTVAKAR